MTYDSFYAYYRSASSDADKLVRIDAIINALYDSALKGAEKADIQRYELDSGQTRIETNYRSLKAIGEAIDTFEKIYNRLYYRLNGTRAVVARPATHPRIRNI